MFGNNPTRKMDHGEGRSINVHSIFNTIQGEGPYAGRAATFIRLHGCHLACHFCDTDFESQNITWTIEGLLARARENRAAQLVVLTGGEPMRQNILPLCELLMACGLIVQIETAGSFWIEGLENSAADIVVSPKTPAVHSKIKQHAKAWKYLISVNTGEIDARDGLPAMNTQVKGEAGRQHLLARPPTTLLHAFPHRVFVQPLDEGDAELNRQNVAACVRLVQQFGYSLSLQQHKIVGVE
jgi:7-carboxy-7-deazaguanine synthase